jgi:hypothetical protein
MSNILMHQDNHTSRLLAQAALDDSSAQMLLALLGTIFLPGTFISVSLLQSSAKARPLITGQALFSMSMFNWNAGPGERVVSSRFWVYWAIAAPLTVVIGALVIFYLKWYRTKYTRATEIFAKNRKVGANMEGVMLSGPVRVATSRSLGASNAKGVAGLVRRLRRRKMEKRLDVMEAGGEGRENA